MAPRVESNPRKRAPGSLTFERGGEECRVDLRAPGWVRRAGRSMVQLIDLWVASLLPGDVLDLTFEIVATTRDGRTVRSAPLDGLRFAQGYIVLATHELWWDGLRTGTPHGLRVQSIVVRDASPATTLPRRPTSAPLPTVTLPSVESLARVLPHAVTTYPSVEWHNAPDQAERSPLHAYLLTLGLLCTACGSPGPGSLPMTGQPEFRRTTCTPVTADDVGQARPRARTRRST